MSHNQPKLPAITVSHKKISKTSQPSKPTILISHHNLVGNMRGAVERLRPHNSTLFRLGCLLYTLQCTVQTTMKSGIFAYLCMCVFVCLCIWTFVKLFILCCNVFAVHATFGPLLLGGSRQWNQEVLCLPSLPLCLSASLHCLLYNLSAKQWRRGMQCCRGRSAEKMAPPSPSLLLLLLYLEASSASH